MSNETCTHQWSIWRDSAKAQTQSRWCHVCNTIQERPKAQHHQEFDARTLPHQITDLPACTTPSCRAKPGEPCLDSNGEPVYIWHHGNRIPQAGHRSRNPRAAKSMFDGR